VFVLERGEVADLVEVVGTVGAGQTDEFVQVREILDSVRIEVTPAPGGGQGE
jgi:hypothetical protein